MVRWIAILLIVLALIGALVFDPAGLALAVAVIVARVISQAAERRGRSGHLFFWGTLVFLFIGALIAWLIILSR